VIGAAGTAGAALTAAAAAGLLLLVEIERRSPAKATSVQRSMQQRELCVC
jgi:hypothetical protein